MAITSAICTSFKTEMLKALHAFATTVTRGVTTADTFKIALYTSSATLDSTNTAYTATNEVTNIGTNYTTGGNTLTGPAVASTGPITTTAFLDFADSVWSASTITASGCMIYNSSQSNKAVAVIDFGGSKVSTAGDFTVIFPTPDSATAIIRFA